MSVKHAILGILADQERHGYDLKEAFDEHVGEFWSLNYGQIYQTLDRLERDGLVACRAEPQEKRPQRKVYRITPKGRHDFERWLTQPLGRPRALRDELFIKLVFLGRANRRAIAELIERQKEVYLEHMRQLTQRKFELSQRPDRESALLTELLMDAALFHAEADVRWLTHSAQKLRTLEGGEAAREEKP